MLVVIKETFKGKEKNSPVKEFKKGKSYNIECPELLEVISTNGWGTVDIFGVAPTDETEIVVEDEDVKGNYGLAESEVRLLPVKQLKAIIAEESFSIDATGKKQAELADAVVEALKSKYKGL